MRRPSRPAPSPRNGGSYLRYVLFRVSHPISSAWLLRLRFRNRYRPLYVLSTSLYLVLAELYWLVHGVLVLPSDDGWVLVKLSTRERFYVPVLRDARFGTARYEEKLVREYTLPGVVEPEGGDVIVDVGAYVGVFSRFAARRGSRVIAIDPAASFNDCLSKNVAKLECVSVVPKAAWNERCQLNLNLSFRPDDNSVIEPDTEPTGERVCVAADTIANIAAEKKIDRIDFMKLEAEGVEPEVLQGAMQIDIRKIAVACDRERYGESSAPEVIELLESNGYSIYRDEQSEWLVVYATKQS